MLPIQTLSHSWLSKLALAPKFPSPRSARNQKHFFSLAEAEGTAQPTKKKQKKTNHKSRVLFCGSFAPQIFAVVTKKKIHL
jgi:hypothetical protein